jgi:hypothetical protein
MGVLICIDGKCVADCNDPKDAWEWLILEHDLPPELFLKEKPNQTPTWEDLPLKFWWNYHRYMITRVDNLKKTDNTLSIEQPKTTGKFYTPETFIEGN